MTDPKENSEEIIDVEALKEGGVDTDFYEAYDDIIVEDGAEPLI